MRSQPTHHPGRIGVWAIGAEVLHDGSGVETADDIAAALGTAIGPVGPTCSTSACSAA
ncbi:hypothetical protein [Saccharopolyspora spinosa]|uniref:hypothetical protein n=1 Tax=Saccharopolyspora spinosa TaxID=60894 RepID=UPI0013053296|nr:hypothetical protein [Saccharopolyspora spinosa]